MFSLYGYISDNQLQKAEYVLAAVLPYGEEEAMRNGGGT